MPNYYTEVTYVTRHIIQFEADTKAEAIDYVTAGRVDDIPVSVMDSDKPHCIVHEFTEDHDGPFMFAGSPFGDRDAWLQRIGQFLIENCPADQAPTG